MVLNFQTKLNSKQQQQQLADFKDRELGSVKNVFSLVCKGLNEVKIVFSLGLHGVVLGCMGCMGCMSCMKSEIIFVYWVVWGCMRLHGIAWGFIGLHEVA